MDKKASRTNVAGAPTDEQLGLLTRRRALQIGAGTVGAATLVDVTGPAKALAFGAPVTERTRSFDEDWRFFRGDASGAETLSFNDSSWRQLDVPHDWSIEDLPGADDSQGGATADPSNFDYTNETTPPSDVPTQIGPFDYNNSAGGSSTGWTVGGIGWYRKHFSLADMCPHWQRVQRGGPAQPHLELRCDGIYEDADIWLNGQHLTFQADGYTPITVDLTPHLNDSGDNVVAIRVNSSGKNSRWYSGSGIYRHTWLTVTGPARLTTDGIFVSTPEISTSSARAHVEVEVANLGSQAQYPHVEVSLSDPWGHVVAQGRIQRQTIAAGATSSYTTDLTISAPQLWSPDNPNLYTAQVSLIGEGHALDADTATFGIRSLEWDASVGFALNGTKTTIRGACIHHSHGPLGAISLRRSEERQIQLLKAAGFNAIRTAHNPPSAVMLDACDRLGMLIWDEFSDMWDAAKNPDDYHLYFPQEWPADLTAMIRRDRNHPSVIIWSLGNEINDTTNGQRGAQMKAVVKSLDPTRPVTQGADPFDSISDPDYQYVDVVDVHYDLPSPDKNALHAAHPNLAMTQSESWPATIYDDYQLALDNTWFVGSWTWVGWDYLGESGTGAPSYGKPGISLPVFGQGSYPWFNDFQGDLDLIGQRKPQNYWRAVVYGTSPLELLVERPAPDGDVQYANNWSYYDELKSWTWNLPQGTQMVVHAYTSGDTVQLLLNGKLIATNTLTAADRRVSTFSVPYTPGKLTSVASLNGREIGRQTLTTVGAPAQLALITDRRLLGTDRDQLAHVLVEVRDRTGALVPDATTQISFSVNGAGTLAATGNGNPHNVDSFQQPHRYTWHGKALIILRPSKFPGLLSLTAAADGLRSARLLIPVVPGRPDSLGARARRSRRPSSQRR
jgi:beta-galactosidase